MIANKISENKLKKYFELNRSGELDPEINRLLDDLKDKIATKLPENKIFNFKVNDKRHYLNSKFKVTLTKNLI